MIQRDVIAMRPVYFKRKMAFFFNEDGKFDAVPIRFLFPKGSDKSFLREVYKEGGYVCYNAVPPSAFGTDNGTVIRMALSQMKLGDGYERLEELLQICRPKKMHRNPYEGMNRLITKINRPIFYRVPENKDEKTFDYIYVDVNIITRDAFPDRDDYMKTHAREITLCVINKLKDSPYFCKYGVPVQFLKVGRKTFLQNINVLQYVFELKEI